MSQVLEIGRKEGDIGRHRGTERRTSKALEKRIGWSDRRKEGRAREREPDRQAERQTETEEMEGKGEAE